jgi:esterase/lipase superfamily enzyme
MRHSRCVILLELLAVIALAGCAGRPHGVLTPTHARAPGTSVVDMLVVTTRGPSDSPGELFGGERGVRASFADIAISIPPAGARQIGEVQWPSAVPGDPSREFVTVRADVLDQNAAVARFDARVKKTPARQALVFVHGFNTRFEEAVYRFAQVVHDADTSALPVLFTWPSRGKLLAYGYDHESASSSRDALEALLQGLARDPNVGEISILAHSMGNWVTLEALRQMVIRDKQLAPKIKNIMLAAPDVDYTVFERQIALIGVRPSLVTLFVSRDDEALAASRRVWGDNPRVGAIDPGQEPYRADLAKDRITVMDLTDVKSGASGDHTKFAESPQVVRAIGVRLAGGQTLSDSQPGIGDKFGQIAVGAASSVGAVAGAAVAAPFAIVDPRTAENMSDRLEQFGFHVGDTVDAGAAAVAVPLK